MQSKRITKYLVAMLGIFALGLLTLTGLSFLPRNNQSASANTQYMTIQKVFVPDITTSDTETDTTKPWHIEESAQTISEGDFVMLDTSKHSYQDSNGTMYTGREAVAVSFVGPSMSSSVSKSIILNGRALETNQVDEYEISSDGTTTSSEYSTFFQYLFALTPTEVSADNLQDCYYTTYSIKDGVIKRVASPEGKYAVSLTYYDPNAVGTQTEGITFYVTTQKTYNQPNENPTLNDTEKLELEDVDTSNKTKKYMTATKQYFNFNNMSTTYYNATQREFITRDKTNPTQLYYPTLIYNPEKFDISYTRTLYNYRETVTATFGVQKAVNTAGETVEIGYLDVLTTTNKDTTLTIKRTYVVEADEDGKYSIKMQFDNVGEYVITKTPKLRIGYTDESVKVNYATPAQDSAVVTANEEYLQDVTLVINGYTALYSKTATTSAPLYDDTYSYGAMENSNTLNRVNDTVYAHDFLVSSDSETIGVNARDRAETIYTADMTFINNSFVNSATLTMKTGLKKNILDSVSNITDSVAFSKFFDYIETTNDIKQSLEYTQNGVNYYVDRASTNLAPVKFEYYGKLYTGNSDDSASWYAFRNTSGNVSVNKYTSGMSFDDAGEYVVYLSYENVVYSKTNQFGSAQYQYMHQIFCFEITNNTPSISVLAQEDTDTPTILSSTTTAETLSSESFTNKFVYASWEKAGPFDAEIYCTYNVTSWDNEPLMSGKSLNGLVYQSNKIGGKYQVSTEATTLLYGTKKSLNGKSGQDGYYQIQVFRSNNSKAWINYTFQIDTDPISGIKTLKVLGNKLEILQNSSEPTVLSALDYNNPDAFNLISKYSFGFTWNEKASHATITAQYLYASITKTTNFDLLKAIAGTDSENDAVDKLVNQASSQGAVYMPTNASLGDFTPAMSYTKIKIDTFEDINTTLSSSQIINTPQLAFLLLRDEAGNTAIYATMLDTTETQVLQVKKQSSYVNVITEDTQFYWGTHKSMTATHSTITQKEGLIRDVYDFVNTYDAEKETYIWTLNGNSYSTHSFITNVIRDLNITESSSINIPLEKVEINQNSYETKKITPTQKTNNSSIKNWFATIKVLEGEQDKGTTDEEQTTSETEYRTCVVIDGVDRTTETIYSLNDSEFRYSITVYDTSGNSNSGGLNVEVNLDKSLGSLRSYWDFVGDGLDFSRVEGNVSDRQYVPNTYSTNRRYIAFSWTDPGETFEIESITLYFYPTAYNTEYENYPYSDNYTETVLYTVDSSFDTSSIHTVNPPEGSNYAIHYQTGILRELPYSADFGNSGASEAGKYVIVRKYKNVNDQTDLTNLKGDKMTKTYTYYVDRNTILPTNSSISYGDETLQFGYNQGEYSLYPDYPTDDSITFDNYGRLLNTDGFEKVYFGNITDADSYVPSRAIVSSNVLPARVKMSTWKYNEATIYDKYYTVPKTTDNTEEAIKKIQSILNTYQNSSRLQVVIQFYAINSSSQYQLNYQNFYSTTPGDSSSKLAWSHSLDDLYKNTDQAFRGIGRYRVLFFDLANFDGLLSGNPETDFAKLSYSITESASGTSSNTLYPNCSVVCFELTGKAPTFTYEASLDETPYGYLSSQSSEIVTNYTKSRVTWTDPSDIYTALNAYNEVEIIKKSIPKGVEANSTSSSPSVYTNYYTQSASATKYTASNPIEVTYEDAVATELTNSGITPISLNESAISQITKGITTIKELIPENTSSYFIKVPTKALCETFLNHKVFGTNLQNDTEFYKVRKSATEKIYTYYLLLPQAEIEDKDKSATKLIDTRYTVNIHYIAKDESDYITADNSNKYYVTTSDLYLDYTAPYYNLVDLIENDTFLNSLDSQGTFKKQLIQDIDNPESTFLKSYAFAVNKGFTIKYRNKYESSTYFYYYKRTNYTGEKYGTNGQVITTNDESSSSPKFAKDNSNFIKAYYDGATPGVSGYAFTESGYYDIIEMDTAGNMRVYTIFVTDDSYSLTATNGDTVYSADNATIQGLIYNSKQFSKTNNQGFTITSFNSADKWMHFKLVNNMNNSESLECYLMPSDGRADLSAQLQAITYTTVEDLLKAINDFISTVALTHDNDSEYGSQIQMTIDNRSSTASQSFYVNTPGKLLITSEDDFLNLTSSTSNRFILKLPDTRNILSTKLDSFYAERIENEQTRWSITSDSNSQLLPTSAEDCANDVSILTGYTFTISNNVVYQFTMIDNFGRKMVYTYPINKALVKELKFYGGYAPYEYDGTQYTFTSNDVDFVYQSNALEIRIVITDLVTNSVLYQKDFDDDIDTENAYFEYNKALTSNLTTLNFNATRGLFNRVQITVLSATGQESNFDFVLYTIFPQIIISDINGSPIQNYLTSKEVMVTWTDVEALFNPYVEIVYSDNTHSTITSGFSVKDEGTYTVRCVNDLGAYTSGQIVFTIQEYLVSIYGVYQITSSGQTKQLSQFTDNYQYTTTKGVQLAISQYMFLSNDSNWERNISVICNEDKDLVCEVAETFGNTRIYHVYGTENGLYQIERYFAVTRIPTYTVSTAFSIDNERTIGVKAFKTSDATITWINTYTDTTATNRIVTYSNFYSLSLYYNGTFVGKYTSGKINLTNSGIYTISISDPVGQSQIFGQNSTTFTLTILTSVVYYVNDNAGIQYATYSDPVDFYVPQLEYYDNAPIVTIYRNNVEYALTANSNGHYNFSLPGSYRIVMNASIESQIGLVPQAQLEAVYQFVIVSPNEALPSYNFIAISGYEITQVIRLGDNSDITEEIKGQNTKITSLYIDPAGLGIGKYQITVRTEANGYTPSQTYTFSIWINDATVVLNPSRSWGSSSRSGFSITVNTANIYERIGECQITINGEVMLAINDSNKNTIEPTTLKSITQQGDYIVQLVSASGTVLQSYRLTITEPLNTATIILIVVAVVVVVVLAIVFIVMRRKVRVR